MIRLKFNGTITSLVKPIVWMLWQRWWVFWRMENKVWDFSTWRCVSRFCWFSFTHWAFHYIIGFDFSPNVNGFSIRRTSWIMVLVQSQDKWPRCSATELRALINPWFHLSSPGAHGNPSTDSEPHTVQSNQEYWKGKAGERALFCSVQSWMILLFQIYF